MGILTRFSVLRRTRIRQPRRRLAARSVVLGAMAWVLVEAASTFAQHPAVLNGYVVDAASQAPIEGAELAIVPAAADERAPLARARSGRHGGFAIERPADDRAVLVVKAPGRVTFRSSLVRLDAVPTVRLAREAALAGQLRDCTTRSPLSGAVTVISRSPGNIVEHTRRAPHGAFEVRDLFPGSNTIVARSSGYAPVSLSVQLSEGRRQALQGPCLVEGTTVRGRVVTRDGFVVRRATLAIEYPARLLEAGRLEQFVTGTLTTDEAGRFSVGSIVPGVPFSVLAGSQSMSGRRSAIVGRAGELQDIGDVVIGPRP